MKEMKRKKNNRKRQIHCWLSDIYVSTAVLYIYTKTLILHSNPRLEDAHQSEARGFLWGGVQLAGEAKTRARCPSALSGHADLPSRG